MNDDLPSKPGGGVRRCIAPTSSGSACGASVQTGSEYCFFHDPSRAHERDEARQRGGKQRARPAAVLDVETPAKDIASVADVKGLLSDTIHQVRTGALDPKVANCVGYLSGILLKAIEVGDIEERLAAMEAVVGRSSRTGYAGDFDRQLPGEDDEQLEHDEHEEDAA